MVNNETKRIMNTMTTSRTARVTATRSKAIEKRPWKLILGTSIAAVLLLSGSVWAWKHYSHLSRLRKAGQLIAEAVQNRAGQPGGSPQRRFGFDDNTRQAIDNLGLTQAERDELAAERREEARRRGREEMDRYLAMSEKERAAYMQKRAAELAKQYDQSASANKNAQGATASTTSRGNSPGNNSSAGGSRGPGSGPRGPRSPDQRLQAQKRRLDSTTPQERAQRTIFIADLTKAIGAQNSIRAGQGLPLLPLPRTRSM
jgi:hypothetical protein